MAADDAADDTCCWCDAATPASARSRGELELVMSDEFDTPGRTFANGADPKWTALERADDTNGGQVYYSPDNAETVVDEAGVGALRITTSRLAAPRAGKPLQSAQLQGWNKFCFTGGAVEVRARVPANSGTWPSLWLLGNLARAVYTASGDGVWPWSYDACLELDAARLPPRTPPQKWPGRGAAEMDLVEARTSAASPHLEYASFSLQVAPRVPPAYMPAWGSFPSPQPRVPNGEPLGHGVDGSWYSDLTLGAGAAVNAWWYGPRDVPGSNDAITGSVAGMPRFGGGAYHTFGLEWRLPDPSDPAAPLGFLRFTYDGDLVLEIGGGALNRSYVACGAARTPRLGGRREACCFETPPRLLPDEPTYLILSQAVGNWADGLAGFEREAGDSGSAHLLVDWVRVWQRRGQRRLGCDPPNLPTAELMAEGLARGDYGPQARPLGADTCPPLFEGPLGRARDGRSLDGCARFESSLPAGTALCPLRLPVPAEQLALLGALLGVWTLVALAAVARWVWRTQPSVAACAGSGSSCRPCRRLARRAAALLAGRSHHG